MIDAHTDLVSKGSVYDDVTGFYVHIDSADEFPLVQQNSMLIQPGLINNVVITPTSIKAGEEVASYPVGEGRRCLFKGPSI